MQGRLNMTTYRARTSTDVREHEGMLLGGYLKSPQHAFMFMSKRGRAPEGTKMTTAIEVAIAKLKAIGLHPDLAAREASRDAGLAMAVAPFIGRRLRSRTKPPILNRTGFILAVLRDPQRYGFSCVGGRWQAPGTRRQKRKAPCILSLDERRAKVLAARERFRLAGLASGQETTWRDRPEPGEGRRA
jgi:hypothetical protein